MSRFRASGIHFLISLAVMSAILFLMLAVWYPNGFFQAMGGGKLFFILAGVDVVLGPLLTLIVFRAGKKGLKLDLAIIALVQMLALGYGMSIMFQARPAYLVFVGDKFLIASASTIEKEDLLVASRAEWRKIPLTGPQLVAAEVPKDPALKNKLVMAALSFRDLDQFPQTYVPYVSARDKILKVARPLVELRAIAPGNPAAVEKFLRSNGRPESDFIFVPLRTRWQEMAVILDAETTGLIKIIPAQPWN